MITFRASRYGGFWVNLNGDLIGKVVKVERWVVRGKRIEWEATTKNGKYLGSVQTRKQAAELIRENAA